MSSALTLLGRIRWDSFLFWGKLNLILNCFFYRILFLLRNDCFDMMFFALKKRLLFDFLRRMVLIVFLGGSLLLEGFTLFLVGVERVRLIRFRFL
jgi:hypothetical protein